MQCRARDRLAAAAGPRTALLLRLVRLLDLLHALVDARRRRLDVVVDAVEDRPLVNHEHRQVLHDLRQLVDALHDLHHLRARARARRARASALAHCTHPEIERVQMR